MYTFLQSKNTISISVAVYLLCLCLSLFLLSEVRAEGCSYKENGAPKCEPFPDAQTAHLRCDPLCPPPSASPNPDAPPNPYTECAVIPNCPQGILEIPLDNPIGASTLEIDKIIGTTIGRLFGAIGSLSLVVFLYGGFMWLTSAGEPAKIKKGNQAMAVAVVGIFMIFGGYAILNLLFTQLLRWGS